MKKKEKKIVKKETTTTTVKTFVVFENSEKKTWPENFENKL